MNKVELLAPAGSFEALKAAVAAGADAIYLGGSHFGARAYAANFSNDELAEAIRFAHVYHVKVYVTVNTLVYDQELPEVMKYIEFLYNHDADAVIVQDLGLLSVIRRAFPDFEIHASTQMSIHNLEGVKFLQKAGVKRVVLARENTIEEVADIVQKTGMDIEVFVHGALCLSYSGQCLMSSLIGGRSGNRGRCAQPCRKSYHLYLNGKLLLKGQYVLSPKDLNTVNHMDELIESGVRSLKIEGRMKSPEYVAIVVSKYRKAIEAYYDKNREKLTDEDRLQLKQIFNRDFTQGFILHAKGDTFINLEKNNNSGVLLGKVVGCTDRKARIKLNLPLSLGDGIYFEGTDIGLKVSKIKINSHEVKEAKAFDTVEIDLINNVNPNVFVYKTTDTLLEAYASDIASKLQIIPLDMELDLYVGQKPQLKGTLLDGTTVIKTLDQVTEKSRNQKLDRDRIAQQLNKLGDTPYYAHNIFVDMDEDAFIMMGMLNELRRLVVFEMIHLSENRNHRTERHFDYFPRLKSEKAASELQLAVYCRTDQQLKAARECEVRYIYADRELDQADGCYGALHRIEHHPEISKDTRGLLAGDLGTLELCQAADVPVVFDFSLNVTNSESIAFLKEHHADVVTLSIEMNEAAYKRLGFRENIEVMVYGYQETMISKHCPFASNCQKQCRGELVLEDVKNEKFRVFMDNDCHMHILNSKCLFLTNEVQSLIDAGYGRFRLQFAAEGYDETMRVIRAYQALLNNHSELTDELLSQLKADNLFTRGYFNKDIL